MGPIRLTPAGSDGMSSFQRSVRIASAKRRLRRMEEDRPQFLKRIATQTEAERQLAIRTFEETLKKMKQELDNLIAGITAQ